MIDIILGMLLCCLAGILVGRNAERDGWVTRKCFHYGCMFRVRATDRETADDIMLIHHHATHLDCERYQL